LRSDAQQYPTCDLCGDRTARLVLLSDRLDGPLVRCQTCQLYFVAENDSSTPIEPSVNGDVHHVAEAGEEMARLARRALELGLVDPHVEESELPWRASAACERLADLTRFVSRGRLLELGSSTGEFLAAASERFDALGVEADLDSSRVANERGLTVFNGTLGKAKFEPASFDVTVLYHTIEHLRSPSTTLRQLHELIRQDGLLVLETPDISTFWFRLLGHRWRQLIPDHRYFFTPQTIEALCRRTGFAVREVRSVGKSMSFRLFASRVGRYQPGLGRLLSKFGRSSAIEDRTMRLRLGDVMRVYATKI
jgi:SAM-dependent methyltransferase